MYEIPFETESLPGIAPIEPGASAQPKCPIPLQKETPSGLEDTICNGEVKDGNAGLCK